MMVGRDRAEELFPLDEEEIRRQMLREARRNPPPGSALPEEDEGLFTRVYRWKEAVCMAHPGPFRTITDIRSQLRREVRNLFLAGDYMGGILRQRRPGKRIGTAGEVAEMLRSRTQ